jgi:hypothetical protein
MRWHALFLAGAPIVAAPAAADIWVATADLQPSSSYTAQITIDDTAGEIEFILTGPTGVWFALGLGATEMDGTYAIVTTPAPAVEERTLGQHSEGTGMTPSVTIDGHVVNGDGTSVFTLARAQDPGTGAYVFDMLDVQSGTPIPVIWGVGQDPILAYHGPQNRGSTDVSFEEQTATAAEAPAIVAQSFGKTKLIFRRVP